MAQPDFDQIEQIINSMAGDGRQPGQFVCESLLNGSANKLNVNGSLATPVKFIYQPAVGFSFQWIQASVVLARNTGTFKGLNFGHLPELTNGCLFYVEINPTKKINLLPQPIKSNNDFAKFSGVESLFFDTRTLLSSFNIAKALGNSPMKLSDTNQIVFEVRDNLTTLTNFEVLIQGYTVGV